MTKTTGDLQGHEALADFHRAPAKIRDDFWAKIRAVTESDHVTALRLHHEGGNPRPIGQSARLPRWTPDWRRRAEIWRTGEEVGFKPDGVNAQTIDAMKSIDADLYVERLVGVEIPPSRKICCPLPDHDERTPSFHVRDRHWRCFGCGQHGSIYDLAGALWEIEPRGSGFAEVHKRLAEVFAF